jgi:hypothetical protein
MPTFESIPIHPSVRSRLQQDNDADSGGFRGQESRPEQRRQQQQARSGVSIPRSLLTRDLNELVDTVGGGNIQSEQQRAGIFAEMETIRGQVAHRMISKTRNGKRLLRNHQHDPEHGQKRKKHKALIPGASVSVLEAWSSQNEMLGKDRNRSQMFSTGCKELDELIAFPADYLLSLNGDCGVRDADLVSGEAKGLAPGYVLKLSGKTGKTQLAMQFVAQAMVQSSSQKPTTRHNRIRYCYSTAGHSGRSLAQRLFQLIGNNTENIQKTTFQDAAKNVEFEPIATVSQLTTSIAKLEEEWLQHAASIKASSNKEDESHGNGETNAKGTVSMLVLDALPLMMAEREDAMKIQSLERWLKRLARHYSVFLVIVATTGSGGSSSIYKTLSPDIHLQLDKRTPTTVSVRLLRHPAKSITKNDCIVYTPPNFNA